MKLLEKYQNKLSQSIGTLLLALSYAEESYAIINLPGINTIYECEIYEDEYGFIEEIQIGHLTFKREPISKNVIVKIIDQEVCLDDISKDTIKWKSYTWEETSKYTEPYMEEIDIVDEYKYPSNCVKETYRKLFDNNLYVNVQARFEERVFLKGCHDKLILDQVIMGVNNGL